MNTHPLQSDAWAEFRSRMGIDAVRVRGTLVTFHKIPHSPWTIGYSPKGPLPTEKFMDELMILGKQKNALFIQLEPNVTAPHPFTHPPNLVPSHHPLFTKYTFILDLTKTEDALLTAMHPKTRYNIKVAQKHHVIVAEDDSPAAFREYLRLTEETKSRQKFFAHDRRYHEMMWDVLHKTGIAHLFTATLDGEVLSAWIIFVFGDTAYYPYGASGRSHREVQAPTLLLWEIAKWAKAKGLRKFDLWGALGPEPDSTDPWYGFHRFKQGFNPKLVEFIGSYDLVIQKPLYFLYTIADTIRWNLLRLLHR